MPVELMLMPQWFPVTIWRFSYWSRTVIAPLLVVAAMRGRARNPGNVSCRELFVTAPERIRKWHHNPTGKLWGGFFLNLITGSILFAAHATTTGYVPMYYAKLTLIAVGMVLSVPIRKFVDGQASDGMIPPRVKGLAVLSLIVWTGVITTGRLIAYVS